MRTVAFWNVAILREKYSFRKLFWIFNKDVSISLRVEEVE